jgi:hypothetical protein
MPGGYHPPPAQIHPGPGCTVVHAVVEAGGAGTGDGTPTAGVMPGGVHPPFAHAQPGPGCAVVHPVAAGCAAAGAAGSADAGAALGGVIPGGYQPPFAQVHPGPGLTVVHAVEAGAAGGGAGAVPPGIGIPGGSQPPATQTQSGPGRTLVHSACAAGASAYAVGGATRSRCTTLAVADDPPPNSRAVTNVTATNILYNVSPCLGRSPARAHSSCRRRRISSRARIAARARCDGTGCVRDVPGTGFSCGSDTPAWGAPPREARDLPEESWRNSFGFSSVRAHAHAGGPV